MKKIILLILIPLLYLSCSKETESEDVTFELLPVSEVELPVHFSVNKENNIRIKFVRPTECHAFNRFYFEKNGSVRTFAVESTVFKYNNEGCPALENNSMASQNLKFNPDETGEYTLKFWNGKDSNGVDLFLTYTILVE